MKPDDKRLLPAYSVCLTFHDLGALQPLPATLAEAHAEIEGLREALRIAGEVTEHAIKRAMGPGGSWEDGKDAAWNWEQIKQRVIDARTKRTNRT